MSACDLYPNRCLVTNVLATMYWPMIHNSCYLCVPKHDRWFPSFFLSWSPTFLKIDAQGFIWLWWWWWWWGGGGGGGGEGMPEFDKLYNMMVKTSHSCHYHADRSFLAVLAEDLT